MLTWNPMGKKQGLLLIFPGRYWLMRGSLHTPFWTCVKLAPPIIGPAPKIIGPNSTPFGLIGLPILFLWAITGFPEIDIEFGGANFTVSPPMIGPAPKIIGLGSTLFGLIGLPIFFLWAITGFPEIDSEFGGPTSRYPLQ